MHDNALHDLALITMNGTRYVGTQTFLVHILQRSHEINISPTKEVPRLFLTKHYSRNKKIYKLQSSHIKM